ncbi:MAG: hypothetical protein AABX16_00155 [Nanoarchaeota archaeon]
MKNRIGTYFPLVLKNSARLMEEFISKDNWASALQYHTVVYNQLFNCYMEEKNPESKKRLATPLTNVNELITGGKK